MRYTKLVCALAVSALAAILLVACGSSSNDTTGEGGGGGEASGGSLSILSWDGYDEPEWLKQFEQESGISVTSTSVGSPAEMFSKVKANPSQYDIVLATAGWFPQYVEADLLEPIDEAEVPAMKDIKLGSRGKKRPASKALSTGFSTTRATRRSPGCRRNSRASTSPSTRTARANSTTGTCSGTRR